jgi:surface antigen
MVKQSIAAALGALALAGCSGYGMSGGPALPPPGASAPLAPTAPATPAAPTRAALGGVLGGPIGAGLSNADRQVAWEAQIAALNSGQRRSWRGAQGVFGYIEPGPERGAGCRSYAQTIYVSGRANRGQGVACKEADGSWRMAS